MNNEPNTQHSLLGTENVFLRVSTDLLLRVISCFDVKTKNVERESVCWTNTLLFAVR